MIVRFLTFLLFISYLHPMQKDLSAMSVQEYRAWFANATNDEIDQRVIQPLLQRSLMPIEQYEALIARKASEWEAQKELRLQQAKYDRLKICSVVAFSLTGWACITTYILQDRITDLVGACLQI